MKKEELLNLIDDFVVNDILTFGDIRTAVDEYTEAIIAQSKCSTLRDHLVKKLKEYSDKDFSKLATGEYGFAKFMIAHYTELLKMIDVPQPVA